MRIIVLFNLRPGVEAGAYEDWARATDIPAVRALGSVAAFDVYRADGMLTGDGAPPYDYVEMIEVSDDAGFGGDVGTETMQAVAAQFREFADDPQFVLLRDIAEEA